MEINFKKVLLSKNKLATLFVPETVDVSCHPSFNSSKYEKACWKDYDLAMCVAKINAIIKKDRKAIFYAITDVMKENGIAKMLGIKMTLSKHERGKYLPTLISAIFDIDISDEDDIKISTQRITYDGIELSCEDKDSLLSKVLFDKENGASIRELNISKSIIYKFKNGKSLWDIRSELLNKWIDYKSLTLNDHHYLVQDCGQDNIFVVVDPMDNELSSSGQSARWCHGFTDIGITQYGVGYEQADNILNDILHNRMAILRLDKIKNPLVKSDDAYFNVYTCCHVRILQNNLTAGYTSTDKSLAFQKMDCTIPLKDVCVESYGEYKRIINVDLDFPKIPVVNQVEIANLVVNPFIPTELVMNLGETIGEILNYTITCSDNMNYTKDTSLNTNNGSCQVCK